MTKEAFGYIPVPAPCLCCRSEDAARLQGFLLLLFSVHLSIDSIVHRFMIACSLLCPCPRLFDVVGRFRAQMVRTASRSNSAGACAGDIANCPSRHQGSRGKHKYAFITCCTHELMYFLILCVPMQLRVRTLHRSSRANQGRLKYGFATFETHEQCVSAADKIRGVRFDATKNVTMNIQLAVKTSRKPHKPRYGYNL